MPQDVNQPGRKTTTRKSLFFVASNKKTLKRVLNSLRIDNFGANR